MIRKYLSSDRQAVERLIATGLREQAAFAAALDPPEDEGFFETDYIEHLLALEADPDGWWVIGGGDESIAGCLWIRSLEDALGPYRSVREIVVDPAQRRKGFGEAMLRHAESISRNDGVTMLLISGFKNNPAINLYRRLGFADFPDRYRKDKNPNHVVLWKSFVSPEVTAASGTTSG